MTLSDYSLLKSQVIHAVEAQSRSCDNNSSVILSLKTLFKQAINSPRRFEKIQTIQELLLVLELRDVLSHHNVSSLAKIAEYLNDRNLLCKISEYEDKHEYKEPGNYYTSERVDKLTPLECSSSTSTLHTDKRKERIVEIITEQIGTSWKTLARNLKIQEWKIDDIDDKLPTLAMKAAEIMKLYLERADRVNWHLVLCEALDKSRRKNLRFEVQNILTMNI